ncbi:hypothetical protein ZIOFF_073787 [Zingiber officinale]|uniref:Uncharacterized protein n=1 Tax=Zingiber officinale TaxID=94328 RepID=A0A8J5BCJ8_ZINOF|nr:hypothetical protein ZIOFF_073787 [Zingiber officinale]
MPISIELASAFPSSVFSLYLLLPSRVMDFDYATPFNCLLFDLDDTLYSPAIGIGRACRNNIEEFLASKCGISAEEASSLRAELFQSHGSSLAGLIAQGYDVHPDEYHSYVHGRSPYDLIEPDATLRELLLSVPQRKIVPVHELGPASRDEGAAEIGHRGLLPTHHLFRDDEPAPIRGRDQVFEVAGDPQALCSRHGDGRAARRRRSPSHEFAIKPSPSCFCQLFLDDSERNIDAGKALDLRTALVGKRVKTQAADYLLGSIAELKQMIPEIWKKQDGTTTTRSELELESMRPTTPIGA